jgi:hypothetical protein
LRPTIETTATTAPATAVAPKADCQTLKGRWLRPDGGYVLEVRSVDEGDQMEASYNNPGPMRGLNRSGTLRLAVLAMPLTGLLAGCFTPAPPAAAVLAGTWAVTVENAPDLKELLLTFDSSGNIQTVQYQIGSNAIITVPAPVGATSVENSTVSISVSFNTNTLAFNGTLDDANNVITGSLTTLIAVGDVTVTIDNGPTTLTKQ